MSNFINRNGGGGDRGGSSQLVYRIFACTLVIVSMVFMIIQMADVAGQKPDLYFYTY
jgi:hypothetical protein